MTAPFIVLALPRSRTFWASRFLSYGDTDCEHDPARHFASRADAADYLNRDGCAAVDTSLGMIWAELASQLRPDLRVVVVHRNIADVAASLRRLGFQDAAVAPLEAFAGKLWDIPGWHIPYRALDTFYGCLSLSRACRDDPVPFDWWVSMKDKHIECDRAGYMLDAWNNRLGVRAVFGPQEQVTVP
jgi:hypothetical protein